MGQALPNCYTAGMGTKALEVGDLQRSVVGLILDVMDRDGLSVRTVAARIDVSHARLSRVLRCERAMTMHELGSICDALGISMAQVLRESEHSSGASEMLAVERRAATGSMGGALAAELRAEVAARMARPEDVAAAVGVTVQTLNRLLRGERSISMDMMCSIADALGVRAGVLVDRAQQRLAEARGAVIELRPEVGEISQSEGGDVVDFDGSVPAAALDYGDDPEQEA